MNAETPRSPSTPARHGTAPRKDDPRDGVPGRDAPHASAPHPAPGSPARPRRPDQAIWATAAVVGLLVAVLASVLAPHRPQPPAALGGDPVLVQEASAVIDGRSAQAVAVARFPRTAPDDVQWAFGGTRSAGEDVAVGAETPFETGSIFKVITAMTLAEMSERGETAPERTLGEVFPELGIEDPALASATLADLATHTAGLTSVPAGPNVLGQWVLPLAAGSDPYRATPEPLEALRTTSVQQPGEYRYSNLGYAVLGAALAEEAGTPFPELVRERILDPLGMHDTLIATTEVPPGAAPPHLQPGARAQPWLNPAYAPAGVGTWSTPADMVRLAQGVATGEAPGLGSLGVVRPDVPGSGLEGLVRDGAAVHLGLGWHIVEDAGSGTVTMHNGATYGTQTMLALGEDDAVVVMGNAGTLTATEAGIGLLGLAPEGGADAGADEERIAAAVLAATQQFAGAGLTLLMLVLPPLLLGGLVLRGRTLITQRRMDRLRLISLPAGAVAWMLAAQRMGDWSLLPAPVWGAACGAVVAGLVLAAWRFRAAPVEAARVRGLHLAVFPVSLLFSAGLAAMSLWGLLISRI
ncbi:serine hydrolase domain-containing protein [Sediminivirga luteola]|uniref:serine hydrolase domain-containing protein n=1 Tax=Sediminivirga luteola TaxID=1774748 RepID=UPI001665A58F|nr:serine hydrolase domain-containing protein [Sediminivirga luteola]MCI2265902.1 beta-lactamase family protein [Sediminivirga luteola]